MAIQRGNTVRLLCTLLQDSDLKKFMSVEVSSRELLMEFPFYLIKLHLVKILLMKIYTKFYFNHEDPKYHDEKLLVVSLFLIFWKKIITTNFNNNLLQMTKLLRLDIFYMKQGDIEVHM